MRARHIILGFGLVLAGASCLVAQRNPASLETAATPRTNTVLASASATNAISEDAARTETNIARVTAAFFEQQHFLHHRLDQGTCDKFFDAYLDALDGGHIYFLQSDLNEFEAFRTNLGPMTLRGDTHPADVIFARFMQRAGERCQYVTNLLATEKFEFTGQEHYTPNRHKLPAPKDMTEAQALWRQEIRWEFLQEKLNAPEVKFAGPAKVRGGKLVVELTKDKEHPLPFAFLPDKFYDASGRETGSVMVSRETNAVARLSKTNGPALIKFETKLFSADGKEIGRAAARWVTNEIPTHTADTSALSPSAASNAAITASSGGPGLVTNVPPLLTNQYMGVIEIHQKNILEIIKTLTNRYVRILRNLRELDHDDVFQIYLTSLGRAYDPHSEYMGHSLQENFDIMMRLSLFGIGAVLTSDDGYCKISELTENGPAARSGRVRVGDRIVAVAQDGKEPVDVVGMKLTRVVEQIRGPKGTKVLLTVIPAGAVDSSVRQVVTLVRDKISLEQKNGAKARIYETPGEGTNTVRMGVIDLPLFYDQTTRDVARLIERLEKEHVQGIILDLRRNGGGYLEEAVNLTGLFITHGPVVQIKGHDGMVLTLADTDSSQLYDGPLIVLASRFTASASEIVAGALQDYGRALIIGDKSTYGKGTVQKVRNMDDFLDSCGLFHSFSSGGLKLTEHRFYRPSGMPTQRKGVTPDIELPSITSYMDVGEASMDNAFPEDEVESAEFERVNMVKPYFAELAHRSEIRRQNDRDFAYIAEDIQEYQKTQEDKSVSLNEAERLAEKKADEARIEARKKERAERPKSNEKVYELTADNVDQSGLFPPVVKTNDVASAHATLPDLDEDDDLPENKNLDPILDEARRILSDYTALQGKKPELIAK